MIKATICLHNFLRLTNGANYLPSGFVDCESNSGDIIGDWRKVVVDGSGFQVHPHSRCNRYTNNMNV